MWSLLLASFLPFPSFLFPCFLGLFLQRDTPVNAMTAVIHEISVCHNVMGNICPNSLD